MANKTQRIDERYQIRRGPDGTLLVSLDGVKWLTPAEAGIATEAYADEGDATTLAESKDYTDTKSQEAHEYTDDQIDLAKEEMQNYTDDEVHDLGADIEEQLSDKADLINGRVPASQLPAFADTLETFDTEVDFPAVGESNVIYVAEDTNYAFRWNGTGYTRIGESLVLGETASTAYRGDRGAIAYSHTLLTDNPHAVNKTQVGLSNVDNTSDLSKPISTATQTALNGKANTSHTHAPADVTGLSALLDGKENTFTRGSIIEGDNVNIDGELSNRLVGSGDITISATDAPAPLVMSVAGKTGAVTLNKSDVGLGGVDNTSDANKPVSTATQTALNGKANTAHTHAAGDITSGVLTTARLGSGTANNTKYLAGDSTWKDLPGAGGDATTNTAQTFTNKRINPRVSSTASGSTLTPTVADFDQYACTALAANLTINAPTGTPVDGNKLIFAIKDNGTSRTLTWNADFAPAGVAMPTSTTAGKWHYVGFIYNATAAKWHCIAATKEA